MTRGDAISRQAVNALVDELARAISDERGYMSRGRSTATIMQDILDLPPVKPQENERNCVTCERSKDGHSAGTEECHLCMWESQYKPKTGYCKDCKYFEYDSVAKVDGIPLIVAHEICNKWGDGCKTKEDGYCFLFEKQERSDKEAIDGCDKMD